MENQQQLEALFQKYLDRKCTDQEVRQLVAYFGVSQNEADLKAAILDYFENRQEAQSHDTIAEEKALAEVHRNLLTHIERQPSLRRLWPRIAAVASILLFLSVGGYWLFHKTAPAQLASNDVAPYSKQAILKTGHGKTLQLDSTHKGLLAQYANTNINTANDEVTYTNNSTAGTVAVFDTLEVPAGGKPYHLKLADGSRVIVNVASVLRFPENFRAGNNDLQLLSGEAYFSIIHNAKSPLMINAKNQVIEDIGTEFNVNTYEDEPDNRTTLVAGAVRVNNQPLHPGQQAIMKGASLSIADANVLQVTAWINGYFRFNGEHTDAVMRELIRWYNIEVRYQGKIPDVGFYLKISRAKNISEVLDALQRTTNKVHFKLEGRRVTVSAKK